MDRADANPRTPRTRSFWRRLVVAALATASAGLIWQTGLATAATVGSAPCVQNVSSTSGVSAVKSGANCVVSFSASSSTITWTRPSGLTSATVDIDGAGMGSSTKELGARFIANLTFAGSPATVDIVAGGRGQLCNPNPPQACSGRGGFGGPAYTGSSPTGRGGDVVGYGGRGGGGASAVVIAGTRVLVAGGGGGPGGGGNDGSDASGGTGGAGGTVDPTCAASDGYYATSGAAYTQFYGGGQGNGPGQSGGGGGYAGGGAGGYSGSSCNIQNGGTGGRGSSYINPTYATATGSSVGKWSTSPTAGVTGTNTDYTMYTNTGSGSVTLTYAAPDLAISTQPPATATSGATLSSATSVTLRDVNGNVASGVTVTASIGTSPGGQAAGLPTLTGTTTATTNGSGVATFSNLTITGKAGAYALAFDAPGGYATGTSNTVTLSASNILSPAQSIITTAASTLTLQSPLPTTLVTLQARDSGGNNITSGGAGVTISPSAGSMGTVTDNLNGTYTGTFTAPITAGTVTISGVMNGVAVGNPATVTINPGAAAALAVGTQPAAGVNGYSGQALGTQPTVRVVDNFGNTVANATNSVTASVITDSGTSGTLGGTTTRAAVAGVSTFTNLAVTGAASATYRLRFAASGLGTVDSNAFQLAKAPQTISFTYSGGSKTVGDARYTTSASTTATGLAVSFAGTSNVCSVVGDATGTGSPITTTTATISILGAGTCTITASQPGNADYRSATNVVQTFSVAKGTQPTLTVVFATPSPWNRPLGIGSAGGAGYGRVTYSLVTPGVCTWVPTTLTFSGPGTCQIQATKAGDANWNPTTSAVTTITATAASQFLTFNTFPPARPLPGGTYSVRASASSGLTPSLAITTGAGTVCSINAGTSPAVVSFLATGTCVVTASQPGNASYTAANSLTQTISVGALNQSITFAQPPATTITAPPFLVSATASSGLGVTFTSSTPSVCTVSAAGLVDPQSVGTCTIEATQPGNAQYAAASTVPQSFPVNPVPPTGPFIQSASAGDEQITLAFTPPGYDGGDPVVGWQLVATPSSGDPVTSDACVDVTAPLVCTIEGLTNGTAYTVTVAGINGAGVGSPSVPSPSLTPAVAANAVQGAYAVPGNGSVTLNWTAIPNGALGGGTFTRYEVYQRQSGGAWPGSPTWTSTTQGDSSHVFTGLSNGTSYDYKIVVITSANATEMQGNTTEVSQFAATPPGAPSNVTTTPSPGGGIIVSWSPPVTNGGIPVGGYEPVISPGATCAPVNFNPVTGTAWCEVTGLAPGTQYTISISASNTAGVGGASIITFTTAPDPSAASGSSSQQGNGGTPVTPTARRSRIVSMSRTSQANQARAITLTTRVRVSGPGVLTQVGRRVSRSTEMGRAPWRAAENAAVLCSARRTVRKAGYYRLTCRLGRAVHAELAWRSMRVKLTTTLRSASGRPSVRVRTVVLPRLPAPRASVTG